MSLRNWVETNVQCCRELARQELANSGREQLPEKVRLAPFFGTAAAKAAQVATIGATLGVLGAYLSRRNRPKLRALQLGAMGGAIGFGAGFAWRTRALAAGIGRDALRKVNVVRNRRWLAKHPIDYA
jgi:hypothetical protein